MQKHLEEHNIEIVVLAGFMRILTAEFVNKWKGRLLNTHPALLPSFKGMHAVRDALAAGVTITGCTVHFVEAEVDAGGIIAQAVVPIHIGDTEDDVSDRIKVGGKTQTCLTQIDELTIAQGNYSQLTS
eukprot:m.48471 g.48471  ORF g.48471 m.48471 type:complete len:128 (-) comp12402_c0_seq4:467-850(-)